MAESLWTIARAIFKSSLPTGSGTAPSAFGKRWDSATIMTGLGSTGKSHPPALPLPAPRLSACAKALADRRQAGLERGINADL